MRKCEYISVIEQLNVENKRLQNSKEFMLGNNMIKLKKAIIKCNFSFLFQKIRERTFKGNLNSMQRKEYDENFQVNGKCVVYTCITGNYDSLVDPLYINENFDYVLFTDNQELQSSKWKIKEIPITIDTDNPILINRYIKMHPHKIFKDYDYSIYIDGNVRIVSSIESMIKEVNNKYGIAFHKHSLRNCIFDEIEVCRILKKGNYLNMCKQAKKYKQVGFPFEYGLCECNVIITNLQNITAHNILEQWWTEFQYSESGRDQIALPYILWKNNISVDNLATLGENVFLNPKFQVINHNNN